MQMWLKTRRLVFACVCVIITIRFKFRRKHLPLRIHLIWLQALTNKHLTEEQFMNQNRSRLGSQLVWLNYISCSRIVIGTETLKSNKSRSVSDCYIIINYLAFGENTRRIQHRASCLSAIFNYSFLAMQIIPAELHKNIHLQWHHSMRRFFLMNRKRS